MKHSILAILCLALTFSILAQEEVKFEALDKLTITADLYFSDSAAPLIILCHQANSSRGEYKNIAPKLVDLGFNCLALDLRNGGESNGVTNETLPDAVAKKFPTGLIYCEQDILAGMEYASKTLKKENVILIGSSYSASLNLMIGAYDERVLAIVAFSPGEYISDLSISTYVQYIAKPTFATGSKTEITDVKNMMTGMNANYLTMFLPKGEGEHGTEALDESNENHKEYWDALEKFLTNKI